MPARSTAQRRAVAIAEHHPDALYARNRALLQLTPSQQHAFAATKEQGLPRHVKKGRGGRPRAPATAGNRYDRLRHA